MSSLWRTALVTGANRGFGLAVCRQLLGRSESAIVFAACRRPSEAAALHELANRYEDRIHLVECDVTDNESVLSMASAVYGLVERSKGLDLLVHSAGVTGSSYPAGPGSTDIEDMIDVYDVNVVGTLRVTQALTGMLEQAHENGPNRPPVVAVHGSLLASLHHAQEKGGASAYRCSKAALNMLVQCVAKELDYCSVACIAPGRVDVDMDVSRVRVEVDESVTGVVNVLEQMRKGQADAWKGKFVSHKGEDIPW